MSAPYFISAAGGKILTHYALTEEWWTALPICPRCRWHNGSWIVAEHLRLGCRE